MKWIEVVFTYTKVSNVHVFWKEMLGEVFILAVRYCEKWRRIRRRRRRKEEGEEGRLKWEEARRMRSK